MSAIFNFKAKIIYLYYVTVGKLTGSKRQEFVRIFDATFYAQRLVVELVDHCTRKTAAYMEATKSSIFSSITSLARISGRHTSEFIKRSHPLL